MNFFLTTFALIFVAEIADKSRVAGLVLSTTYKAPWPIFWGMTLAYAALTGIAVWVGVTVPAFISTRWTRGIVGVLFLVIGVFSLAFSEEGEEKSRQIFQKFEKWGPFLLSFVVTALSEMGDRTQIATAGLAANNKQALTVFAGSLSALAILNLLTVWLGERLAEKISIGHLHRIAAILFIVFGIVIVTREFFFQ